MTSPDDDRWRFVGPPNYPEEYPMPNPLTDALSPTVRKYAYAVLFVAALVFATYQAADGDWLVFAGSLVTALLGALAASNTTA